MGIVSYAQNFEDVMLWRALGHIEQGFYIDIGANDPVVDSVSKAFYDQGWRGIHVEPMPLYADLLRKNRPDEKVIQAAVSSQLGMISFYEIADTGLSTADAEIAERHRLQGWNVQEMVVLECGSQIMRLSLQNRQKFEQRDCSTNRIDPIPNRRRTAGSIRAKRDLCARNRQTLLIGRCCSQLFCSTLQCRPYS